MWFNCKPSFSNSNSKFFNFLLIFLVLCSSHQDFNCWCDEGVQGPGPVGTENVTTPVSSIEKSIEVDPGGNAEKQQQQISSPISAEPAEVPGPVNVDQNVSLSSSTVPSASQGPADISPPSITTSTPTTTTTTTTSTTSTTTTTTASPISEAPSTGPQSPTAGVPSPNPNPDIPSISSTTTATPPVNISSSSPSPGPAISNTTVTPTTTPIDSGILPEKGDAEKEHSSSLAIFFVLCVLGLCILFIHGMIQTDLQYLPESIVVIFLGALIGLFLKLMSYSSWHFGNWQKEEALSPTAFFLVLLPPIIFESGYNLHKGNFFQNIGSICVFAIFGTLINAFVIGAGVYILGVLNIVYKLSFVESCAFGSLLSAVDPVATLALFNALEVDPILNMLVTGESILNDAVAIVLTTTVLQLNNFNGPDTSTGVVQGINDFCIMFFASAGIGVVFALTSALLLKHIDLRKNPSLEFGMMLIFTYIPYAMADGIHLSGIMAILFCGIVMSHYTHFNLSPVTQITMQQTMRTLSFIAETCVFAYLGLAIFSFHHRIEVSLIVWVLFLVLGGRALNVFPLGNLVNKFRTHKISNKMLFIMWFSGLRGAIAYALSLHMEFEKEIRQVIITTTLIIVLFTTLVFGGLSMPIIKYVQGGGNRRSNRIRNRRKKSKEVSLSKTKEMGQTIDQEHLSEFTEDEIGTTYAKQNAFVRFDLKYLRPFFTRRFTQQELKDCQNQMSDLTNRWYQNVRISPINSDDEDVDVTEIEITDNHHNSDREIIINNMCHNK